MRIAVVGPLEMPKPQGGVTRHCEEVYGRIAASGEHEVTVLCAGGPAPETEYRGMRVRRLRTADTTGWERLTYALAAAVAATRGDFDVVHFHSFASSAFCWLPRLRGRAVVTTAHRIEWQDAKWGRVTRGFLRYCEWAAVRFSDSLLAVSQALKDDLLTRHPRAARTELVSNGVTRPDPAPLDTLADLGLRDRGYVAVVGRLVPEKGVDIAIDGERALLERLAAAGAEVAPPDLAIVGGARHAGNDTEQDLRRRAAPAGDRIRFLGILEPETVAAIYDHALALVAPSYQEGQPLVVAEAMAAGCCVVASDIPAHLELLGDTALFFPAGDAGALAERLQGLVERPDEGRALGARAQARFAAGDYSWDTAAVVTASALDAAVRAR